MAALYTEHALGLTRLAQVMLGDRAAAEDVVHDAFCGLCRRWDHLTDPWKASAYSRSSVLNGCRSALRRQARGGGRAWRPRARALRPAHHVHPLVHLVPVAQAHKDLDGVRDRRLRDLDRLEPASTAAGLAGGRTPPGEHQPGGQRARPRSRGDEGPRPVNHVRDVPARPELAAAAEPSTSKPAPCPTTMSVLRVMGTETEYAISRTRPARRQRDSDLTAGQPLPPTAPAALESLSGTSPADSGDPAGVSFDRVVLDMLAGGQGAHPDEDEKRGDRRAAPPLARPSTSSSWPTGAFNRENMIDCEEIEKVRRQKNTWSAGASSPTVQLIAEAAVRQAADRS